MKKYLLLFIIAGFMVSCGKTTKEEKTLENQVQVEQEIQEVDVVEETKEILENLDLENVEVESQYIDFEVETLEKYIDSGITEINVAPFSKGIDILLTTSKKDFSQEDFNEISKILVETFKENYGIDKELEIGVSLDYRENPNVNVTPLYNIKLK